MSSFRVSSKYIQEVHFLKKIKLWQELERVPPSQPSECSDFANEWEQVLLVT